MLVCLMVEMRVIFMVIEMSYGRNAGGDMTVKMMTKIMVMSFIAYEFCSLVSCRKVHLLVHYFSPLMLRKK